LLENSGWSIADNLKLERGNFNFCVALNLLLGFAEDYNKILLNGKHELVLLRGKDNDDVYKSTAEALTMSQLKMTISSIVWKMPHVQLSDAYKLYMFNVINKQTPLLIPFRSWDIYYNPVVPQTTTFIWSVKLAVETERPRYVIIAFKNNKKYVHCDLVDVKVYLNSEVYPYDGLNQNFTYNRYALLYDMYINFQKSYYGCESQPLLSVETYKNKAPIIVLDVTHQNEAVKSGPIDIRIEIKTQSNIPPKTSAYCLIIHDRLFEYTPLSNEVKNIL